MNRREFVGLTGGLAAWPLAARAQQVNRVWRIGVLSPGSRDNSPPLKAFLRGLTDLGYVEGGNLTIDWKFDEGRGALLATLAGELVRANVDLIFAINTPAALAAKNATNTIPIVVTRVSDPIRTGLVAALARPGRNITGLTSVSEALEGKRLELLKEALPRLHGVAVLWNKNNAGHAMNLREMEAAGSQLDLKIYPLGIERADEVQVAIEAAVVARVGAVFAIDDLVVASFQDRILELAFKYKLPVVSQFRDFSEAGGLLAYGPNNTEMFSHAAIFVDQILKGAKPADLPVKQPNKFELVINLKTAKALNLTISPSLLARADEVIE